jgi:hypothetical protein
MPPKNDIDFLRADIESFYFSGQTKQDIIDWLSQEHHIIVSSRTLKRRLSSWNILKTTRSDSSDACKLRIFELFSQTCLHDKEMVDVLCTEGYQINQRGLQYIRMKYRLLRRHGKGQEPLISWDELLQLVDAEFQQGGIRGYGRTLLYTHFH